MVENIDSLNEILAYFIISILLAYHLFPGLTQIIKDRFSKTPDDTFDLDRMIEAKKFTLQIESKKSEQKL